jgi:hypothetical protein
VAEGVSGGVKEILAVDEDGGSFGDRFSSHERKE